MSLTTVAKSKTEILNFEFNILIFESSISELWVLVGIRLKEVHTLSAAKFMEKCLKQCEKSSSETAHFERN